jgi:beta-galactosidase/beta-glucuronidase
MVPYLLTFFFFIVVYVVDIDYYWGPGITRNVLAYITAGISLYNLTHNLHVVSCCTQFVYT